MSIKEYIKEELLRLISLEKDAINARRACVFDSTELFQIVSEENFLVKLENFANSI